MEHPSDLVRSARLPEPERSPLLELFSRPPRWQRALSLVSVAYLPFWVLLLARALLA